MMDYLYIAGLVVGLLVLYLLCTVGFGFFIISIHDTDYPEGGIIFGYIIGCVIFLFLAVATLKAYNMVPDSEETLAVIRVAEETTEEIE